MTPTQKFSQEVEIDETQKRESQEMQTQTTPRQEIGQETQAQVNPGQKIGQEM